jgi:hypothetical protein
MTAGLLGELMGWAQTDPLSKQSEKPERRHNLFL